jgi:hypothetical protein
VRIIERHSVQNLEYSNQDVDMLEGEIMNLLALISAGVVAGIFMPLFSQLPILNLVNCIPCGWIWLGGIIAVGLYRWLTDSDEPLFAIDGAILGIFTGIVAAFTSLILAILLGVNTHASEPLARIVSVLDQVRGLLLIEEFNKTSFMFLFLCNLVFFPLISLISSFIGIQIFGKFGSRSVTLQDPGRAIQIEQ